MHFYSLNVNMINCYGVNNYLIMPLNSFKLQNISNIQKIINPCTLPILFCLFDSDFLEIKCSSLVFSDPCSFLLQSHFTVGRCVRFLPSWGFILSALCLCPWRVCGRLFFWSWRCFPPWHPWPPASSLTCCLSSSLPGFLTAIWAVFAILSNYVAVYLSPANVVGALEAWVTVEFQVTGCVNCWFTWCQIAL